MLMVACLCPINFTLIALMSLSFLIIFTFRISKPFLQITLISSHIYSVSLLLVSCICNGIVLVLDYFSLVLQSPFSSHYVVLSSLSPCSLNFILFLRPSVTGRTCRQSFYSFGCFLLDWVPPLFFASCLPCSFPIPPFLPSLSYPPFTSFLPLSWLWSECLKAMPLSFHLQRSTRAYSQHTSPCSGV